MAKVQYVNYNDNWTDLDYAIHVHDYNTIIELIDHGIVEVNDYSIWDDPEEIVDYIEQQGFLDISGTIPDN